MLLISETYYGSIIVNENPCYILICKLPIGKINQSNCSIFIGMKVEFFFRQIASNSPLCILDCRAETLIILYNSPFWDVEVRKKSVC